MNLRKIFPVTLVVGFLWVLGCTGQTSTANDYINQGLNSAETGDLEQAIENFTRALDLDSENAQAYHNRGFAYAISGDFERAIEDFSKVIGLNPDDIQAHYNRGNAYAGSGDLEQAIIDYTKVIELNPDDTEAYFNRGAAADGEVFVSGSAKEFVEEEADLEFIGGASIEHELPDTEAGQIEVVESEAIGLASEEGPGTEQLAYTEDMKVLFEEMTFVQVMSEEYARIEAACAGIGLNNINPLPDGPMILIPNAGDLAVNGANVAIRLDPDGEKTFIPRVQGQRIKLPMEVGEKGTGEEVTSLTLDEAMQLMAAGKLEWTAKGYGLDGTGHGLPGHIAECDPRYEGA